MTAPLRLVDPDDAALNAAFATEVCGWHRINTELHKPHGGWANNNSRPEFVCYGDELPPFTTSADAVLPWLEKHVQKRAFNDHTITVTGENYYVDGPGGNLAKAPTFAKAIAVALLRAHGVTVEFSK